MTYGIAIQTPETPIGEEWSWLTDVNTSYNGLEDRSPLLRYPRKTYTGNYRFDDASDLRRHQAMMTARFKAEFRFPLFQYQCKLKAKVSVGDNYVAINALRGDFRVGGKAVIIEGSKYEEVEISTVNSAYLILADELTKSFTQRAIVCPVVQVYTPAGAAVTRQNPDHSAVASFTYLERLPTIPFVPVLNTAVVDTFDGLPVLPYTPIGSGFNGTIATGLQAIDYTAFADLISPWNFAQWGYNLTFKASLYSGSQDFQWWQKFADLIQGSAYPFLMATNRSDLELVTPANGGGNAITVRGDEYTQHYWNHGAFKRIFIDTDAGRHYATVTAIASIAGNDRLVFAPALPAGAAWGRNQRVGFLLKLRNDNDRISCNHLGLTTQMNMAVRTVT